MTTLSYPAALPTDRTLIARRIGLALLWLVGLSSGFVLFEPAPYEFLTLIAILWFAAAGMRLAAPNVPLAFLLILNTIGFCFSLIPVIALADTAKWTAVSGFLCVGTLFFAMVLGDDTERRLDVLLKAYIASAVLASMIGILAYFKLLPSSDTFLFAQRAKATFKDPNVFGPFLVLPGLLLMQRMMLGRLRDILFSGATLLIIVAALFLSFSRGAWGHFGFSALLVIVLTLFTTSSVRLRARIIAFSVMGVAAFAVLVAILLSLAQVQDLFQERASLNQSYDVGRYGRFGRHIFGALMALDHPNGIGPLQFSKYFPEDPHNSFLNAFMSGGWLGGVTWLALIAITLVLGLRQAFARTPWQTPYLAVYATFVGATMESYVIDVQHWRHYFLLIGLIWGLVAADHARKLATSTRDRTAALPCRS